MNPHPLPADSPAEMAAERERFEAWYAREHPKGWSLERFNGSGDYVYHHPKTLWIGWLAAIASIQARPVEAWISVNHHRPMLEGVGEEDVDVWTWDGKTVREDTYGLIFEQPAGPMVGGWVCTGEGFGEDTAGTVTHWMLRVPPAAPTKDTP